MQTRLLIWVALWILTLHGSCISAQQPVPPGVSQISSNAPSQVNAVQLKPTNEAAVLAFKLRPTAIASAGADGAAEIKPGTLSLHISQLTPGKYELQAVRHDGSSIPLGRISIIDPTLSPDRDANDNKKEASNNAESVRIATDVQITLPPELSEREIKQLQLLGPGGNAVLVSDTK